MTKLRRLPSLRTYDWYKCIATIAKAVQPDALQFIKDEALHIAAKAAFPRTTRLLLAKGANPNSRGTSLPSPIARQQAGTGEMAAVTQGTTPTQEVSFHPVYLEEGENPPTVNECHWRSHIYPVQVVVFPKGTDFPLVTGCPTPNSRLAGPPGSDGDSGMCIHSGLINLAAEELGARPYRVYEGYRAFHTMLALLVGGGDLVNTPEAEGTGTHEECCAIGLPGPFVAHGMWAPTEILVMRYRSGRGEGYIQNEPSSRLHGHKNGS